MQDARKLYAAYKRGVPVKWSDGMHRVEKKRVSGELGTVKVFVAGRWRFWPHEVQTVPSDTENSSVWGQDGNVDYVAPRRGGRRSTRVRKAVERLTY